MADPICILTASRVSVRAVKRNTFVGVSAICLIGGFGLTSGLRAQAPSAAAYPVDPVAAAGMTTGLPNGVTSQQAEMMQVRTSAQGAQGEAAAALMARSADQSIEERNREIALQAAREKKSIKQSMTERLKFERAEAANNKVSSNEMSTWKTQGGGVRVERNVPDAFMSSLIAEEEQAAARAAASGERKGFGLFRKDSPASSSDSGGGFRMPRLPFMGGGGSGAAEAAPSPPPSDVSEPAFAQTAGAGAGSSAPAPAVSATATAPAKPSVVPAISGAALINGNGDPAANQGVRTAADQPPSSSQTVSFSDSMPDPEKKRSGLFSKFQSGDDNNSTVAADSGGGGFFGFGKKKADPSVGKIDAGLFPEGAVSQSPAAGRQIEGFTKVDTGSSDSFASTSTRTMVSSTSSGSVELPGQTMEKEKTRGFSIPKPSISIPSLSSITKSERSGGGDIPTLTTVNSAGSSYYVVASTAQFMVYGASQIQSEVRALPAGTVVLMTKPGEQWASIRLSSGIEGIVQNKHLRPASSSESNVEFATPAPVQ